MGYLRWGSKPSKKGRVETIVRRGGTDDGGSTKPSTPTPTAAVALAAASSGGCMNAVLHMFDLQRFHLCLQPNFDHHNCDYPPPPLQTRPTPITTFSLDHHHHHHPPSHLQGVEAPRNSLESEEMVTCRNSLASVTGDKNEDDSHIPVGIEMNTCRRDTRLKLVQAPRGKFKVEDMGSSVESSDSPGGARTPSLVARLMGLDILPDSSNSTPRSSLQSPHTAPPRRKALPPKRNTTTYSYDDNSSYGPHSLPETPRRLSLQISKDKSIVREIESARPSCSAINTNRKLAEGKFKYYEDVETRSPGYYARQIMKQVRETVSRRVGVDITNTINTGNGQRDHRRDEHLLTLPTKPKKPNKPLDSKSDPSPKLKTSKIPTSKTSSLNSSSNYSASPSASAGASEYVKSEALSMEVKLPPPLPKSSADDENKLEQKPKSCNLKKKVPPKSFDSIRNKREEQFVRPDHLTNKKSKKTPLSNDLLHTSVPSFVPLNKDASKLHQKHVQGSSSKAQPSKGMISKSSNTRPSTEVQLSCGPSQQVHESYQKEVTHVPAVRMMKRKDSNNSIAEFQYISRILKCTGIDKDTPVTLARWFSTSHPLDPSIFHTVEASHYANAEHHHPGLGSSNRSLLFHLVDEILVELLKPYVQFKPSIMFGALRQYSYNDHQQIYGFQLVKILCTRIRSFPNADCQTLEDIDALVERDLPRRGAYHSDMMALEEEGDAIVLEIECDILDSLLHEVALFCFAARSGIQNINNN